MLRYWQLAGGRRAGLCLADGRTPLTGAKHALPSSSTRMTKTKSRRSGGSARTAPHKVTARIKRLAMDKEAAVKELTTRIVRTMSQFFTTSGLDHAEWNDTLCQAILRLTDEGDSVQNIIANSHSDLPDKWTARERRRGYFIYGLVVVIIATVANYFAPSPDTAWGWYITWVVSIIAAFGLLAIGTSIFASDERIMKSF